MNKTQRAFLSKDGLGRLIAAIMLAIKNGESYDDYRMAIAILARQMRIKANQNGKVIKLLTLYNATVDVSDALTVDNCLESKDFLRFMSNQFK